MLYFKAWFLARFAPSAPLIDLQLLKDITNYKVHNSTIADIAMRKFLGHLWYLSEELVAFAFFDDGVSVDMKRRMVAALQKSGTERPLRKITLNPALIGFKQLEDFVTNNTLRFFTITGISADFLKRDVDSWESMTMPKSQPKPLTAL